MDGATTLVTVNRRLAAELRRRIEDAHIEQGLRVWPSPDVLPWSAWLQRLYHQLLDRGGCDLDLLDPTQEALIWEEVIAEHPDGPNLLRPGAAAASARTAHQLLHDWYLDSHPLASLGGDDTRTFLDWRRRLDALLDARGLLTAARLPGRLQRAFEHGDLDPPKRLVHAGFEVLTPAQAALFAAMQAAGCRVTEYPSPVRRATLSQVAAADAADEIGRAAEWAQAHLQADPRARLGIVVPQLGELRDDIARLFGGLLAPRAYLDGDHTTALFDISLGTPLAERPLVAHALLALDLLRGERPLAAIGQLLRSPFIGGHADEWGARALLDAALREDGLPRVDLDRLRTRLAQYGTDDPRHCPELARRLAEFAEFAQSLPRSAGPEAWAAHLQRALALLGWPGDRGLDSDEFQTHERMRRLFSELAALAKVRLRLGLGEAVQRLGMLATETVFQPESPLAPIRILGPLEAVGLDFDALWLLGLHDQVWPPPPRPDPLLPVALQRELGMPHASAARELAFASRLTETLAQGAAEVVASWPRSDGDRLLRPSPLIREWPCTDLVAAPPRADAAPLYAACAAAGLRGPMPPVAAGPAPADLPGGAGLLAAQAACPFMAVARYRLAARPLEEARSAADPALLGTLVHELLQRLWNRLGDSQNLAAHDDDALRALIAPIAEATLADLGRRRPDLFTARFRALETERLTRLMLDWLAVERRRGQAFEVSALEQDRVIALQGLRLKTRADRVDRLADGSLAVIDYKTGRRVARDGWFDTRLSEPQLPLYCLDLDDAVGAAMLARVRRDDGGCAFVGVGHGDDVAPGVAPPGAEDAAPSWEALLAHWRTALGLLATEVAAGRADPTPSAQACEYCPYGALCRVRERQDEAGGD